MTSFDPRKYDGRRVKEIVRTLNGDIRAVLDEARTAYRLCLRQDHLPEHLKGFVRMHLWQVEKKLGLHARYFSQAGQDRYLAERIFKNKRTPVWRRRSSPMLQAAAWISTRLRTFS